MTAPQILDACCGGRHWWWNKAHPLALYIDVRKVAPGSIDVRPNWECAPDELVDFRAMPFADESFSLVLFDPPISFGPSRQAATSARSTARCRRTPNKPTLPLASRNVGAC